VDTEKNSIERSDVGDLSIDFRDYQIDMLGHYAQLAGDFGQLFVRDAQRSIQGNQKARPTTYVLNGFATVKTYDETRRRDQKSRAYREIKLAPGEYTIDGQLTIRNTEISLHRSIALRVPNFLASGIGFGTARVMAVPTDYKRPFARWSEAEKLVPDADSPIDASVSGLEREPAVRFSVYLDHPVPGPEPCDIYYEVQDQTEHQLLYGKHRVMLDGKTDDFLISFSVDDWEPGVYRVNLRARAYSPDRDARFHTVDWVAVGHHGAIGVLLGVRYRFGGVL
jgi:hypothetical protein